MGGPLASELRVMTTLQWLGLTDGGGCVCGTGRWFASSKANTCKTSSPPRSKLPVFHTWIHRRYVASHRLHAAMAKLCGVLPWLGGCSVCARRLRCS